MLVPDRLDAAGQALKKVLISYKVLSVSAAIASLTAKLRAQYKLGLPDALELAIALDVGVDSLVTHDRDFGW